MNIQQKNNLKLLIIISVALGTFSFVLAFSIFTFTIDIIKDINVSLNYLNNIFTNPKLNTPAIKLLIILLNITNLTIFVLDIVIIVKTSKLNYHNKNTISGLLILGLFIGLIGLIMKVLLIKQIRSDVNSKINNSDNIINDGGNASEEN